MAGPGRRAPRLSAKAGQASSCSPGPFSSSHLGLRVGTRTWQPAAVLRRAPAFSARAGLPEPAPGAALAGGGHERSLVDAVLGVTWRGGGGSGASRWGAGGRGEACEWPRLGRTSRPRSQARISGALEETGPAAREPEMWELRHRGGGGPGPGGEAASPPREGEAAGGDHETESTSDKVSGAREAQPPRPGLRLMGAGTPGREGARVGPRRMSGEAARRAALRPG